MTARKENPQYTEKGHEAWWQRHTRVLPIAADGACSGHACDECAKCRAGYCCRRDNPDYKLPKEGDWHGPIYGQLGMLAHPDDHSVECHCCGESFGALVTHILLIHDLTTAEYKAIFGLNRLTALTSRRVSVILSDNMKARPEDTQRALSKAQVALDAMTPEQLLYTKKHDKRRESAQKIRREAVRRSQLSDTFTCRICSKVWTNSPSRRSRFCSTACYDTYRAEILHTEKTYTRSCVECGTEFTVTTRIKSKVPKCCSSECRDKRIRTGQLAAGAFLRSHPEIIAQGRQIAAQNRAMRPRKIPDPCTMPDCTTPIRCKGLCSMHYQRKQHSSGEFAR